MDGALMTSSSISTASRPVGQVAEPEKQSPATRLKSSIPGLPDLNVGRTAHPVLTLNDATAVSSESPSSALGPSW